MADQEKNIRTYLELATFWPICKDFEAEYTPFDDTIFALIKNYAATHATMTNQVADHLATRLLDLEERATAENVSAIGGSKTRSVHSRRPDLFTFKTGSNELSTYRSTRNFPRRKAHQEAAHEG